MIKKMKSVLIAAIVAVLGGLSALSDVALPDGYTQLDWIQSSGGQYIDTKIPASSGYKFDFDLENLDEGNDKCVMGYKDDTTTSKMILPLHYWNGWGYALGGGHWPQKGDARNDRQQIHTEILSGYQKLVVDGNQISTTSFSARSYSGKTLYLFANNQQGTSATFAMKLRLYSCKVWDANDQPFRDFVPCRNEKGAAGLWDRVEGVFYPNLGTGKFFGSDEPAADGDVRLSSITFTGSQYIDTGYTYKAYDVFELDCLANATGQKSYTTFFGSRGANNIDNAALVFATVDNVYETMMYRSGQGQSDSGNAHRFPYGKRVTLTAAENALAWTPADGSEGNGYTLPYQSKHEDGRSDRSLLVFAVYSGTLNQKKVDPNSYLAGKFYSFKVTDSDGVVQRNLVPYRKADGMVCVCDEANGNTPYTISGSGAIAGAAVSDEDGVRTFYDGKVNADDLRGFDGFAKDSPYLLDAADVAAFPGDLALKQGTVSFADGAAATCAVNGTLTLKGGARIELDVLADGNDQLAPTAVAVEATAEDPAKISLAFTGVGELEGPRTLIAGGLTSADLAKIKVMSALSVRLRVTDAGALVVEPKATGEFVWTGAAQDGGLWSTAANWEDGARPENGGKLVFGLAAGGTTQLDDQLGMSVERVTATATAGAFVHGGNNLSVTKELANESSAGQTFQMPMTLGLPSVPFTFATAGDLTLTNGVLTAGASEYVKTGTGTLALNDEVVAAAEKVTVGEGTLRLNHTGRVQAAATAGEIRIRNGACLDVNCNAGNAASLARTEVTHGKTVYIEGYGPDRLGALVNTDTNVAWGCTFGRLVITGDAASGGTGNLSVRPLPGSRIPGSRMEGPGTFSIKGSGQFNFNTTEFALGGIVAEAGSNLQFEGAASGTVTNGVTLADGAYVRLLEGSTVAAEIPFAVPDGASANIHVQSSSGVSSMSGTLRVDGQLALTLSGGNPMLKLMGTLVGNGALMGSGLAFAGAESCWSMTADGDGFTEKVNVDQVTDAAFLTGLKRIKVRYTGDTATPRVFDVAPSGNLTLAQALNDIELAVTDADDAPVANCWLEVTTEKRLVLHIADGECVRTAVWRGGADSALDDPANWLCSNDVAVVENKLPQPITTIVLPEGCVFNCTTPFECNKVVLPARLGGDCNWTGISAVYSGRMDLCGHTLSVKDFAGEVTVTDTTEKYAYLEYIQSTKGKFQCINTKCTLAADDEISMRFSLAASQNKAWHSLFGCFDVNKSYVYFRTANGNDNPCYRIGGVFKDGTTAFPSETPVQFVAQGRNATWTWTDVGGEHSDGLSITGTYIPQSGIAPLALFTENKSTSSGGFTCDEGVCAAMKLYACTIKSSNGAVRRDFVPVRRLSDDVVGLLDRAHGEFYPNAGKDAFAAGPVLSTDDMGTLHIVVDEGKTFIDTGMTISGMLKVVKEGEGTLSVSKGHSFSGGTEVKEGVLRYEASVIFGLAGSTCTVRSGATLDLNGYGRYAQNPIVLDGGTILNSADRGLENSGWFTSVTLTDNSTVRGHAFGFVGDKFAANYLEMNGHELLIDIDSPNKYFYMANLTVTGGGMITVDGKGGWLTPGGNGSEMSKYVHAPTTRLRVVNAAICGKQKSDDYTVVTFLDYESEYKDNSDWNDTRWISVSGRFRPGVKWHSTSLAAGTTLDLSDQTGTWELPCSFSGGLIGRVRWSDGQYLVDLGTRNVKSGSQVISWSPENAPSDSVTFKLSPDLSGRLTRTATGVEYQKGLVILFR